MDRIGTAAARAAVPSLVLLLAACGGGGGGSSNPPAPITYTVGGSVSGLTGNSVALRLNGGADLIISANGNYTFPSRIANGTAYTITVQTQPTGPSQTCALTNATGTIAANVTNVTVTCTTNTYRVRGTLGGLSGGSVVLQNNGGGDLTLSANGAFEFATAVPSGGAYAVTVGAQPLGPSQTCVVTQGAGTVAAADVTNVDVNCTINSFSVGGTITGLNGSGLVLRNNGGNNLAVNGNGDFTFTTPIVSGANYLVTVLTQPTVPNQHCTVANESGTVLAANITSVTITCVNFYKIGGTVRGLDVPGLVLRNSGGDDLTVNSNGSFEFATPIPKGTAYNVTAVAGTPASPRHVCVVVNGGGTVSTDADVSNVDVTCEADRFAYVAHSSTVSFNGPGLISVLTMNHQTGALAPIAGTSTFAADNGAVQIVSDPRGRFIYVAHSAVYTTAGTIAGYSVNPASGALTPVPGSPFAAGTSTNDLAIDSEGRFLYATASGSGEVHGWTIQANGSLSPIPGLPLYLGDASMPESLATTPAARCCYLYVARWVGGSTRVSGFSYNSTTGALTQLPLSPFAAPGAYDASSIIVNNTGDRVLMAAGGTSNITTFDIGSGTGALTEHLFSPTPAGNSPCKLKQPPLSPSLFVVSSLSYQLSLYIEDPDSSLPTWLDSANMFAGSYCDAAFDPYGQFVYVPKFDDIADYLFGFTVSADGMSLQPLTLNPVSPTNTYTLSAIHPRTMVLRYSRRDREMLQIPD